MLQRMYGTAWANEKDLKAHLTRLEEAEKRDHRKLGRELDLFHIDEHAPGDILLPFSVALEERLATEFVNNPEGLKEELEKLGTASQMGKIMKTGYQRLSVRPPSALGSHGSRGDTREDSTRKRI